MCFLRLFSLLCRRQEGVDLFDQRICVSPVDGAGHLDGLASCRGTTETVHTDFQKELSAFGVEVQHISDQRIFGYFRSVKPLFFVFIPLYYTRIAKKVNRFLQKSCASAKNVL